jgi:hypothetical protein
MWQVIWHAVVPESPRNSKICRYAEPFLQIAGQVEKHCFGLDDF